MASALDWEMRQVLEKQILGQSICLFDLQSKAANVQQIVMFHTLTKENFSSLGKITDTITKLIGLSNPLGALRGLIGTSVIVTTEYTSLDCKRPFSIDELDDMDGNLSAYGFSVSFGYEKISMSAPNIFSVTLRGATAGMMLPGWTNSSGKWKVVGKD